jgi:hypothetical protein
MTSQLLPVHFVDTYSRDLFNRRMPFIPRVGETVMLPRGLGHHEVCAVAYDFTFTPEVVIVTVRKKAET